MLTRPQHIRTRFLQLADGLLFALAVALAYALRAQLPWLGLPDLEGFGDYAWLLLLSGLTGPIILTQQGFYTSSRISRGNTLFVIIQSCVYAVLTLVIFLFITRVQFARSVILLGNVLAVFMIYARHELTRALTATAVIDSALRRRVLWAGTPASIARIKAGLTPGEREFLADAAQIDPRAAQAVRQLPELLHTHSINVVMLGLNGLEERAISEVLQACEREGVEVAIHPGLPVASPFRLTVDRLGNEPVLYYRAQTAHAGHLLCKQIADYVGTTLLLLILSPLFLLVALLVKFTSRGPVLYRQQRAGLNGRPFAMYKFRSMKLGADEAQAGLSAQNEMEGPVFKIANDPRVTAAGRLLRRHSLDELPQLWNVLRGEMSLVGPRPLPVEEVRRFDNPVHRRRLSVKPGLTCLWQIRGRNEISSFEDWVRLDLEYIDQWSLWLDFKILLATIPVTLFGRGGR